MIPLLDKSAQFAPDSTVCAFAEKGGLDACISLLTDQEDVVVLAYALNLIAAILKASERARGGKLEAARSHIEDGGGLDVIESLQSHDSDLLYQLSYKILGTWFSGEEVEGNDQYSSENA